MKYLKWSLYALVTYCLLQGLAFLFGAMGVLVGTWVFACIALYFSTKKRNKAYEETKHTKKRDKDED